MASIRENILTVQGRIESAAHRAGRDPGEILLVAVTKTHPAETVEEAIQAGLMDFGENRVQEAAEKIPRIGCNVHWHLIGHLQTNKARMAVQFFEMVQSVDSERLAVILNEHALNAGKRIPVLIEVNTSVEESKYGISPESALELYHTILALKGIDLQGLMTVGPFTGNAEDARPCFRRLAAIREEIIRGGVPVERCKYLSMGMTGDFEIAIEEGSNMLRIGSAIFGARVAPMRK